jgi:hypothetical protein
MTPERQKPMSARMAAKGNSERVVLNVSFIIALRSHTSGVGGEADMPTGIAQATRLTTLSGRQQRKALAAAARMPSGDPGRVKNA